MFFQSHINNVYLLNRLKVTHPNIFAFTEIVKTRTTKKNWCEEIKRLPSRFSKSIPCKTNDLDSIFTSRARSHQGVREAMVASKKTDVNRT